MSAHGRVGRRLMSVVCAATLLAGCATAGDGDVADNDPLEPVNRVIFQVNEVVDTVIIRPVAVAYTKVVPPPIQANVTNFLRNLRTPIIFANELLQGDLRGAEVAATRFFLNTVVGAGGLVDIAGMNKGYEYQSEDFGQTLALWGVGDGPYLVLPLLGPSNPRDALGLVVDTLSDPVRIMADNADIDSFTYIRTGATIVDQRARSLEALDEIKASSLDYYASIRSLYRQVRERQIRDGNGDIDVAIPDYEFPEFDDLSEDETAPN